MTAANWFRLSDVLAGLAGDESRERISIGDLCAALGDRSVGALMLVFALPNVVPSPPGTSAITGMPLILLAACLMLGKSPWLPAFITGRSLSRSAFGTMAGHMVPWLEKAERLLRPRLEPLCSGLPERIAGLCCFVLAVIIALPIPLGNILPAIAICCFSLALLERDGLFSLAGLALTAISLFVVSGVLYVIFRAVVFFVAGAWM